MTPVPSVHYLAHLADALVGEIKAEMGRQDLSARALAMRLGVNPQYVTSRLMGGNPRTGKLIDITVSDLTAIAGALDLDPHDLLDRAQNAVIETGDSSAASHTAAPVARAARKQSNPRPE